MGHITTDRISDAWNVNLARAMANLEEGNYKIVRKNLNLAIDDLQRSIITLNSNTSSTLKEYQDIVNKIKKDIGVLDEKLKNGDEEEIKQKATEVYNYTVNLFESVEDDVNELMKEMLEDDEMYSEGGYPSIRYRSNLEKK